MRKLLIACLFLLGVGFALFNFKGLAAQGEFDSIVLDFREDVPAEVVQEQVRSLGAQYNSEFSESDQLYIIKGDRNLLKTLKKSPLAKKTEYIEPNYVYKALEVPNDPEYSKQWNLRSINVESAWDETKGAGMTVAVIDTGISRVPDLKDTKFVQGYDFVNNRDQADDDNGHGTHVGGTVAQATNNGYGVAGIAYEASLMPLKVLSAEGGGTVADIAEAIKFAADNGADVINMSLGGGGESQVMQEAIDYAYNKGVVIVAAAGNSNENSASYPARYPHVIGVSAIDSAGEKAFYSSYGAGVDISAPGGAITEENPSGGILQETISYDENGKLIPTFAAFQGTSMASPHVAGVAALVKASGVTEPEEVLGVLKKSARVISDDALNYFGAGHLDASAAVKLAVRGQITFRDFFRWLRDNGYLNPRFWIDGGAVALLPKIAMVLGSYVLAWFLRNYFPFGWSWSLTSGLVAGSSGLFFLRGFYIFDLPQWPFRMMGSSIPELGNTIQGSGLLNPIFASVLIPFALIALLLGHRSWKWFAIGSTLGVASCLLVSAVADPAMLWLGHGAIARLFLITNALLCIGLAYLSSKGEGQTA
ncbi:MULTISPECIES: S8 family peptidase [unclassified Coleofasciculus]|uniref:S8 family peptidase n=1 Tax=Cyanophyceae TaxID=3028117 RepID=UPI00168533D6|nr:MULTISPECIES: S8 family peptidase [unclassified Coleofasciculus]MBD1878941.1 peptidase S8 [Coleofasciculus sp. FACHB-T130]MBD1893640.1 peptidase S8 [Coleofasciculus sp. FACHB-129]